jgi:hypothetical protein
MCVLWWWVQVFCGAWPDKKERASVLVPAEEKKQSQSTPSKSKKQHASESVAMEEDDGAGAGTPNPSTLRRHGFRGDSRWIGLDRVSPLLHHHITKLPLALVASHSFPLCRLCE